MVKNSRYENLYVIEKNDGIWNDKKLIRSKTRVSAYKIFMN